MPETEKEGGGDADYDPKVEAMRKEEEKLVKESQRKRDSGRGNLKNAAAEAAANEKSFAKLEWFMKQSEVRSHDFPTLCGPLSTS